AEVVEGDAEVALREREHRRAEIEVAAQARLADHEARAQPLELVRRDVRDAFVESRDLFDELARGGEGWQGGERLFLHPQAKAIAHEAAPKPPREKRAAEAIGGVDARRIG